MKKGKFKVKSKFNNQWGVFEDYSEIKERAWMFDWKTLTKEAIEGK